MTSFKKDIALIDKYLRSELTAEELVSFTNRLKSDEPFRQQFFEMQAIREASRRTTLENKLNFLEKVESGIQDKLDSPVVDLKKSSMRKRYFLISAIAASLLLLAIALPMIWPGSSSEMELAMKYVKNNPYPVPEKYSKPRGKASSSTQNDMAYDLFSAKNYANAAPLLAQLCYEKDSLSCFYTGIAYLGTKNPEEALKYLEIEGLPVEDDVIYWYRGLGYWMQGKKERANLNWEKINPTSKYFNEYERLQTKTKQMTND